MPMLLSVAVMRTEAGALRAAPAARPLGVMKTGGTVSTSGTMAGDDRRLNWMEGMFGCALFPVGATMPAARLYVAPDMDDTVEDTEGSNLSGESAERCLCDRVSSALR